ncbi:MAG TPA: 50S ribosomal protein L11 methyltransferase [Anaerolineales bacterium]
MNWISTVIYIIAAIWLGLVLVGYLVPYAFGLPPTPTRRDRIRRALKLAELLPGETLYDLGSGDGRTLVIAAREFGGRAVGIDAGPVQCLQAWLAALLNAVSDRVHIRWGNFFKRDLSGADVVFAYLTSDYTGRLAPQLLAQLRPGARVVTISFDFPEWEPAAFDESELIFLYRMPPAQGSLETFLAKQVMSS